MKASLLDREDLKSRVESTDFLSPWHGIGRTFPKSKPSREKGKQKFEEGCMCKP